MYSKVGWVLSGSMMLLRTGAAAALRLQLAPRMQFDRLTAGCALLLVLVASAHAGERVDYLKQVKPILAERCYSCHGALKQKAELRLETRELLLKGGESGAVIVAGESGRSLLIERVTAVEDDRMPPEGDGTRLSDEEVAVIRAWIDQGAVAPDEPVPRSPNQHWAFLKPVRPVVPKVNNPDWAGNPIDAFLAAGHREQGLMAVGAAGRRTLLRRVYLDLIGLPPSREALQAFENDKAENAYKKVVGELLGRPHHGERWARHWMDVWRYSDWFGLGAQLRNSQKHLWHWRDWIIESLNEDKGYDRMIQEMLAADEISPTDAGALRATGFLARQYYLFNRDTWLDDTIEHTSKAFLGLTMNCGKCHDHKYDPISQLDYYRLRAVFEPYQVRLDALPGETDLEKDGLPRAFDAHPEVPTYLYVRGNAKDPDKSRTIKPGLLSLLGADDLKIVEVSLPPEAWRPGLKAFVLEDWLRVAENKIESARKALDKARRQLAVLKKRPAPVDGREDDGNGKTFFSDDFDSARAEVWETGPGEWRYEAGKLRQSRTGFSRAYLRSLAEHPEDFEALLKFTTVGGDKWRSVGLCFDVVEGREKMVYLSAVSPGSKLQVSYNQGGAHVYPPQGAVPREVKLGQAYEMKISVRGKLVNVAVNGRHTLAFALPLQRERGKIDLVAFDAVVEFDSLMIRELPEGQALVQAGKSESVATLEEAEAAVSVAEKSLAAAEFGPAALRTAHVADRAQAFSEDSRSVVAAAALAARQLELAQAEEAVARAELKLSSADDTKKAANELDKARKTLKGAEEALRKPGDKYTSLRGSLKALEGPDEKEDSRRKPYPKISSGRRTALARRITSRDNPLTARVVVNHIWLRHFGQPLVESVTDFGLRTAEPSQKALLDWLAVELMENQWSMKHLHRLMVTSRAYRLSSSTLGADEPTMKRDAGNDYYWRRLPVRMESQVIRDSLLSMAGVLDETLGGPSISATGEDTLYRRSLYFTHSRDGRHKFLTMFDDADILRCYRRSESVVPQQALTLANSKLALTLSRKLAERLEKELGEAGDDEFIRAAFESVMAVRPTYEEVTVCRESLGETRRVLRAGGAKEVERRSRENLVHALVNHNDFVTIR